MEKAGINWKQAMYETLAATKPGCENHDSGEFKLGY